jgi:hypothetical protein
MSDLRIKLVENYGEDVVQSYESFFPNELNMFDDRYCGHVGDLESWAQECLENIYDGLDDDVIPCLQSFIEMEFYEYYSYDEDLKIGFVNR